MSRYYIIILAVITFIVSGVTVQGQQCQRVVSLAPSLTKNIYYLESDDKLLGCTSYCEMAKPDNKDIIASAVKVNIEKVISLKPDLVVATSITSPEVIEIFRKFNIRTEVFPTPCSFHEICQQFKRLADLMGKPLLASNIIEESKAKVDSIHKNCKIAYNPKVFMQIGAKPLFTVIPNTFMDDYIHYIKGTNIASDFTRGSITRESVIARNPDIIIIVTMGIVGYEEKEIWEAYSNLSASKNNKIFIIDSNIACTPSPYAFVEALELINNKLK